jgi:hypothetical protein
MKMLCFKAFGNRFKQAVEPLNDAKRKVLSTSNMHRRGNVRKVDHMWPNLRIGNIGGVWAGGGTCPPPNFTVGQKAIPNWAKHKKFGKFLICPE